MKSISIIVPCYNEEQCVSIFYEECLKYLIVIKKDYKVDYEIIFINDGSKDNTLNEVILLSKKDKKVKYVDFSRNFGKESAIYAGLSMASGDFVALMDADLQDPPSLLPEMLDYIINEKYDNVATRRVSRAGEPVIRSFFARMFYKLIAKISKTEIVDGARDYRLMNRNVVDAILSVKEYNRFSKGIFGWVGFNTKWLEYENIERVAGETKWSFWKLLVYSFDGIVGYSTVPLAVSTCFGFIFALISILMIFVIIFKTIVFGDPVEGWPSLACIIFMVSGVQLLCIGILGQYLSKTYLESKNRPIYIIKETNIK